jgi:hypothetical protein
MLWLTPITSALDCGRITPKLVVTLRHQTSFKLLLSLRLLVVRNGEGARIAAGLHALLVVGPGHVQGPGLRLRTGGVNCAPSQRKQRSNGSEQRVRTFG